MPERIYLDHAATTPLRPEAKAAMEEGFRLWANPSSPHAEGRKARALLEDARERIKLALGWDGELIFTGGASEALAIGLGRAKAQRRIVSAVEHDAVLRAAPDAQVLPIGPEWSVDREALAEALGLGPQAVVAIQHVNSETGGFQPVDELAGIVRAGGHLLLADCAQSAGKLALPECDMAVVSAHKLGGPPGIGALLARDFAMLEPSGGQERGYRGGTENMPGALGFAAALEATEYDVMSGLASWIMRCAVAADNFRDAVEDAGGVVVEGPWSAPWICAVAMPTLRGAAQLIQFDARGFAISVGSACASGSMKPSRVLKGFGVQDDLGERTVRISFGWNTDPAEIARLAEVWLEMARTNA